MDKQLDAIIRRQRELERADVLDFIRHPPGYLPAHVRDSMTELAKAISAGQHSGAAERLYEDLPWLRDWVDEYAAEMTRLRAEAKQARAEVTRLRARAAALEAELRTAIHVIEDVAPRPWSADLDDPCDEQDSGEYDDEPWVVTDANEATVDRVGGKNEPSNGEWARDYAATVNALGTSLDEMAVTRSPVPDHTSSE